MMDAQFVKKEMEQYYVKILSAAPKFQIHEDKMAILTLKCNEALVWLRSNPNADMIDYNKQSMALDRIINPILSNYFSQNSALSSKINQDLEKKEKKAKKLKKEKKNLGMLYCTSEWESSSGKRGNEETRMGSGGLSRSAKRNLLFKRLFSPSPEKECSGKRGNEEKMQRGNSLG